jgi:hypothetical protein
MPEGCAEGTEKLQVKIDPPVKPEDKELKVKSGRGRRRWILVKTRGGNWVIRRSGD